MYIPRAKICGITSAEDALNAVACGASAIGLVFYAKSPRYVTPKQAQDIVSALPPFVASVGLFVDHPIAGIRTIQENLHLDLIQLHGNESPELCERMQLPYIKAVRVQDGDDLVNASNDYPGARALLADTYKQGVPGGTGQTFDWSLIPRRLSKPLILAGGLNVDNVAGAIRQVRPFAVDVSGGVEKSKGVKDHVKIAQFMREVMNGYQIN